MMQTPVIAGREKGRITLYFHQEQPLPTLPHELSGLIGADTWANRASHIIRLTSRFNHARFEAVWIVASFVLSIVIPAVLSNVIFNAFKLERPNFATHFVSFALFAAVMLVFWVPILIWKFIGQTRANVLVKRWAGEDSRISRSNGSVPIWHIRLPGIISNSTRVTINIPTGIAPTTAFHPQAYTPAWVNARADGRAPNSFADDMSNSLDALPLYDGNGMEFPQDQKAPAYVNSMRV